MKKIILVFTTNRETFSIEILNKVITYRDKRLKKGVQFMPKDIAVRKMILLSRNKIPAWILTWIEDANSGKNLEEYQSAKTDEELIPIIRKDAQSKGCVFQKRREEEVEEAVIKTALEMEKEEAIKLAKEAEKALEKPLEAPTIEDNAKKEVIPIQEQTDNGKP